MKYRFIFKPLTGNFELIRQAEETQGVGGGTATDGTIALDSGASLDMLQELNLANSNDFLISNGAQLSILDA